MKTKPNYQELEQLYKELQQEMAHRDEVERSFASRNEALQKELDCFKYIDALGQEGLLQKSLEDLSALAVQYFAKAFCQPNCLITEYVKEENLLECKAFFGFAATELPDHIGLSDKIKLPTETFLLQEKPEFFRNVKILNLAKASVGPYFDEMGNLAGYVIVGQTREEANQFEAPRNCNCFQLMTNKMSLLFQNFHRGAHLEKEIEDRKMVEEQLAAKTEDLLRSNEDLQQFAYIASHDLKTPLRNITGFAQLLLKRYAEQLDDNGKEYLEFISNNTKQFSNTIENLLQYSRLSKKEVKMEEIDFEEVANSVQAKIVNEVAAKNATIHYGKMPKVMGNKVQMEQLLQNLLTNALKFNPPERNPVIEFNAKKNGQYYIFEVKDNGIGIEEEYKEKIFSLFQRLHSEQEYEGTGLGLAICQKIVERHKGKIWAESAGKNKGTSFFFALPF